MDRRRIGRARNQAAHRVNLADQLALAEAADRRIARHAADRRGVEIDQRDMST